MFTYRVKFFSLALLTASWVACSQADPNDPLPPQTGGTPSTPSGGGGNDNGDDSTTGGGSAGTDTGSEPTDGEPTDGEPTGDDTDTTGEDTNATEPTDTSDEPSGPNGLLDSYFPLGDGLTWTYQHVHPQEGSWDEVVTMTAAEYDGAPAWKLVDSVDRDGRNDIQYWVEVTNDAGDIEVFRVHRDEMLGETVELSVDYDPGFLRFNYGWAAGDTQTNVYIRRAVDAQGIQTNHERTQQFEVLSTSETIEAGGITYDNCLQFRRGRNNDSSVYWYARGIGKVYEIDEVSGKVEVLVEHNLN